LRVRLFKEELSADDAKKALDTLVNERDGLMKKYTDLVALLDEQMKNIDTEITSLDAREVSLIPATGPVSHFTSYGSEMDR